MIFFVRFENAAWCIHARRHVLALANSVCLLVLSHSDRHVLALRFVRADCAVLCCACGTVILYTVDKCSLSACLCRRILIGTYLLCGLVRAEEQRQKNVHGNPITTAGGGPLQPRSPSPVGYTSYCLLYTSPSPRDRQKSRMPSSA